MTDITTLIDTYIATWNEGDPQRRRALVAQTFTEDGTYVDPLMQSAGTDGISEMIAGAQRQFPGHRFELAGAPDTHHDRVRFSWHLKPPAQRHWFPRPGRLVRTSRRACRHAD